MTGITRGSWQYGILLVILFATATVAVRTTLLNLDASLAAGDTAEAIRNTNFAVWALTMGFMFMAGAFGLWAIRFAGVAETRHRIARIVEAMDSIDDWLLAVDTRGRLISHNAPLQSLLSRDIVLDSPINELFEDLTPEDLEKMLHREKPYETEIDYPVGNTLLNLRFRSQPAPGMTLIFISNVTSEHDIQLRKRQSARFQLIGQIARGVAHDFNTILCGISGHASLLSHLNKDSEEMKPSLHAILSDSDKGISLAGKLMNLGSTGTSGDRPAADIKSHLDAAVTLLRSDLPIDWEISQHADSGLSPVSLTGSQLEQVIYHVSLMMVDSFKSPGKIHITVTTPNGQSGSKKFVNTAAIVSIAGIGDTELNDIDQDMDNLIENEAGVILSVIETLLESADGKISFERDAQAHPVYQITVPHGNINLVEDDTQLPEELCAYMSRWYTLVAVNGAEGQALSNRLKDIGAEYEWVDNVISVLSRIETIQKLDAIVVSKSLLGQEADGLLKAIHKLFPETGIVVLTNEAENTSMANKQLPNVLYKHIKSPVDSICASMIEAKSLAIQQLAQKS